jgi:hypothetical protein
MARQARNDAKRRGVEGAALDAPVRSDRAKVWDTTARVPPAYSESLASFLAFNNYFPSNFIIASG